MQHPALASLDINHYKLRQFLLHVSRLYHDVPYHNAMHAVHVTWACHSLVFSTDAHLQLDPLDLLALYLAAACHDVGHTCAPQQSPTFACACKLELHSFQAFKPTKARGGSSPTAALFVCTSGLCCALTRAGSGNSRPPGVLVMAAPVPQLVLMLTRSCIACQPVGSVDKSSRVYVFNVQAFVTLGRYLGAHMPMHQLRCFGLRNFVLR